MIEIVAACNRLLPRKSRRGWPLPSSELLTATAKAAGELLAEKIGSSTCRSELAARFLTASQD